MLKIFQASVPQYMNWEIPDVQLDLEKAEETEIKLPTSVGSLKKQESSRKSSTSDFFYYAQACYCVNHNKLWEILKEMGISEHLPPEKSVCRSRSNS